MADVLLSEFLKLKRSRILLLIPLGGLIPVLLMLLVYMDAKPGSLLKSYVFGWEYFLDVTLYYTNIICPAFFAILTGYVFTREYQHRTINTVFTYSFSRMKVFAAKVIVIIPLMIATFLLTILFTVAFGSLLTKDRILFDTLLDFFRINMGLVVIHLLLIPGAILVGIIGKNSIAPIVLGILYLLCYALLNKPFSVYFPGCHPSLFATYLATLLGKNHPVMTHYELLPDIHTALRVLIFFFAVTFSASIIYYRNSDVN